MTGSIQNHRGLGSLDDLQHADCTSKPRLRKGEISSDGNLSGKINVLEKHDKRKFMARGEFMKHALRRYLFMGAMISLLLVVTACSAAPSAQSLNGTSWNLVKLNGQTLPAGTR